MEYGEVILLYWTCFHFLCLWARSGLGSLAGSESAILVNPKTNYRIQTKKKPTNQLTKTKKKKGSLQSGPSQPWQHLGRITL